LNIKSEFPKFNTTNKLQQNINEIYLTLVDDESIDESWEKEIMDEILEEM